MMFVQMKVWHMFYKEFGFISIRGKPMIGGLKGCFGVPLKGCIGGSFLSYLR